MNTETILGGIAAVLVTVGGSIGTGLLVQRYLPVAQRQENNDVAGLAFAIIGVLYAILLTFVTISVWESNDAAQDSSRREARAVVDLRHYAAALPEADAVRVRELSDRYAEVVVTREWPRMAAGERVDRSGDDTIEELWRVVDHTAPADDAALARQAEARSSLRELSVARDARLAAIHAGLPGVMWLALLLGSGIALANALMFGVAGKGEYLTIIAMLAAMCTLLLYAVYQMEYPYQRAERVTADVFVDVVGTVARR